MCCFLFSNISNSDYEVQLFEYFIHQNLAKNLKCILLVFCFLHSKKKNLIKRSTSFIKEVLVVEHERIPMRNVLISGTIVVALEVVKATEAHHFMAAVRELHQQQQQQV